MDVSRARQQNDDLVEEFGSCTPQDFGPLKDRAMAHNNHVLAQAKTISVFEKRQLKDGIQRVFRAMENADQRLHRTEFRFIGPPLPAKKFEKDSQEKESQEKDSQEKDSQELRVFQRGKIDQSGKFDQGKDFEAGEIVQKGHSGVGVGGGSVHISNQTDVSVNLDESSNGKHVHMQNLSGTTVMSSGCLASMSVSGGTSIFLNVASNGPVMVQNVSNSVLLVRCHQLRIHGCTDCVIFAELPNKRIILEHCRRLNMGSISEMHLMPGDFSVDDFDWPSKTPNPHYSIIASEKLLSTKRVDEMNAEDLKELRRLFEGT